MHSGDAPFSVGSAAQGADKPATVQQCHEVIDAQARQIEALRDRLTQQDRLLAELQERVDRLAILASGKLQALGSVQSLREQAHMPLSINLALAEDDIPTALQVLAVLPAVTPVTVESGLRLGCPREQKMAVLSALAPLGGRLLDLHIQEPSLEDVYFGLREI